MAGKWPLSLAGARRYFADFVAVRRQRVQTIAFVDDPLWTIRKGWRFGW